MTTTTHLIDELAGLLDAMDDGGADLPPTVPATAPTTPVQVVPAPAGAAPQPAPTGEVVVLADARAKAEARKAAREAMVDEAMHAAIDALQVIRRTFTENGADFDDAIKALPQVHKILEHVDRMEATVKDAKSLPRINFTIVLDPNVPQVPPPNRRPAMGSVALVAPDVIDMDVPDACLPALLQDSP